jgi:hypothetical protein
MNSGYEILILQRGSLAPISCFRRAILPITARFQAVLPALDAGRIVIG